MTQLQANQQYVVILGREVQHAGVCYPSETAITGIPEDVAIVHIKAGSLRPFVPAVDGEQIQAVPEVPPEEHAEATHKKSKGQ